jgi:hypothetical protein
MRSLATVGRQIEQMVRARSQQRQVLIVAGTPEAVDHAQIAALEAAGLEVVIVTTGIPRDPFDPLLDDAGAGP